MAEVVTETYYMGWSGPERAVKPTTIYYYETKQDLAWAENEVRQARLAKHNAFTRDAVVFDGEREQCTRVVICDDVRGHLRNKIEAAYQGFLGETAALAGDGPRSLAPADFADPLTVHGPKADPEEVSDAARPDINLHPEKSPEVREMIAEEKKRIIHRGGGHYFVMRGDQVVSGPHTRDEARKIVSS